MAARKRPEPGLQRELCLGQEPSSAFEDIDALTAKLTAAIAARDSLSARVEALNRVRTALHRVSPFQSEPVDLVLWKPADDVVANSWNPNSVAPPEMRLLAHSIRHDGYTQPVVSFPLPPEPDQRPKNEVVDGFHRTRVGKEDREVRARVHGFLPVVEILAVNADRKDRIAATIRHNRARGRHIVAPMSQIVAQVFEAGWSDARIQAELGMDAEEVLRLKQTTGLAALFKDREFSKAWEVGDPAASDNDGDDE